MDKVKQLTENFIQQLKEYKPEHNTITAFCTPVFYERLIGHWMVRLTYKVLNVFPDNHDVRVYAVSKRGKMLWKLTNLVTQDVVYIKRDTKLNSGQEFCWIMKGE